MSIIIIHPHSTIDLITNSSSETFVTHSFATVKAIKDLLALYLRASGSKAAVDEIFTVELGQLRESETYNNTTRRYDYKEVFTVLESEDEIEYEGRNPPEVRISLKPAYDTEEYKAVIASLMDMINSIDSQEFSC
jgi:hypothetical protein